MELSKVDEPKHFLRSNKDKFIVMHKNGFIQENEKVMGENFLIAQSHFAIIQKIIFYPMI